MVINWVRVWICTYDDCKWWVDWTPFLKSYACRNVCKENYMTKHKLPMQFYKTKNMFWPLPISAKQFAITFRWNCSCLTTKWSWNIFNLVCSQKFVTHVWLFLKYLSRLVVISISFRNLSLNFGPSLTYQIIGWQINMHQGNNNYWKRKQELVTHTCTLNDLSNMQ